MAFPCWGWWPSASPPCRPWWCRPWTTGVGAPGPGRPRRLGLRLQGQPQQYPHRGSAHHPLRWGIHPREAAIGSDGSNRNRRASQAFAERFQLTRPRGGCSNWWPRASPTGTSPSFWGCRRGTREGARVGHPACPRRDQPGPGPADDDPGRPAGLSDTPNWAVIGRLTAFNAGGIVCRAFKLPANAMSLCKLPNRALAQSVALSLCALTLSACGGGSDGGARALD